MRSRQLPARTSLKLKRSRLHIDVDLGLDAAKLKGGRYAELLELLLATNRYIPPQLEPQYFRSYEEIEIDCWLPHSDAIATRRLRTE